jgi:3-phosphoshikimate 1-carboxyvinyltransferase
MQYKIAHSSQKVKGVVCLPRSKSISNRALIISALSGGRVYIKNLSNSDDTQIMLRLLDAKDQEKNAGHAGTAMRFLAAYFAINKESVRLTGSERMKQRPIGELVNKLNELGAGIKYKEKDGYPPLLIPGMKLNSKRLQINSGISSQFISSLLMIAPYIKGGLEIELTGDKISSSYIEMTIKLMEYAGATIKTKDNTIRIEEGEYKSVEMDVEPDWSAASYWFAIAGLAEDADILLKGLKQESLQGDANLVNVFKELGVNSIFEEKGLRLKKGQVTSRKFEFNFSENPDIVQSIVPYCIFQGIPFDITGCRTLRIKETDRINALYQELGKFGVKIGFSEDGDRIFWNADNKLNPDTKVLINTYKDHRMAMSFATLCLKSGSIIIDDPLVVTKSYPSFWADLSELGFNIDANKNQ